MKAGERERKKERECAGERSFFFSREKNFLIFLFFNFSSFFSSLLPLCLQNQKPKPKTRKTLFHHPIHPRKLLAKNFITR